MSFLLNPHLDLTTSCIETARCVFVPFSTDGRVDIHQLQEKEGVISGYIPLL